MAQPLEPATPFLHMGETDCVAGVVGFELRCAERIFISLRCRVSSDSGAPAETAAVPRENDLLRWAGPFPHRCRGVAHIANLTSDRITSPRIPGGLSRHVCAPGSSIDRLATYRGAVGARAADIAEAAGKATKLLARAVAQQAAVLSYIDGFLAAT